MTPLTGPRALIPDILHLQARWQARKPALVFGDTVLSWSEFGAGISQVAQALTGTGLPIGSCVAIAMQNGVEMPLALMGAATAGFVSAPLNLAITDEAMAGMLADASARVVIVTPDQAERIDRIRDQLPDLAHFILAGADRPGWTRFEAWISNQPAKRPDVALTPDLPFNIIYSSGTTGQPKGILHTQATRLDWALHLGLALRYHSGVRTLCNLGLYSNISWVMMLCTWINGGTLVLQDRFDAGDTLSEIEEQGITHSAMVPVQYQRLLDHPDYRAERMASLQAVMSCGSALPATLKARLFDDFHGAVIELYGLTEGVITTLDPEVSAGRLASVGKPIPGTDLRILGEDDRVRPTGEAGEIVARGSIVMPGYLNRPDATAEASWTDETGQVWLRTGDIGKLDAEGFLYIVDRKKDMIISGGQNIYPADIEAVFHTHPAITAVAVIGLPDAVWGETPVAIVEAGGEDLPSESDLLGWANDRLGKRQRIRAVFYVDALPRNPNGKILKRDLRRDFAARMTRT